MINANEQRVISVASGTFEYGGKTYKAKAAYVSQLRAKMDKDGVDLTSADANAAIQQIMANVGTGVKQGYLVEVGGTKGDENSEKSEGGSGSKSESSSGSKTEDGSETKTDSSGDKTGAGSEKSTADGNAGEASDGIGNETSDGTQTDGTQTDGTDGTGTDTAAASSAGITQIYPEEAAKVEIVQKFTDNADIAQQTTRAFGQYLTAVVVIWVLFILGTAVYLKKIKRRKKMTGGLVGIILVGVAVIAIGFGYLFGREVYATKRWTQVVTESAYLKESYENVVTVMQECLDRAGLPEETLDSCMDENAVYRDAKTLAAGGENAKKSVLEKRNLAIQEAVAAAVPGVPEEQQTGMAQILVQKYKEGLEIPWQVYIEENREAGRTRTGICLLIGIIGIAAGILILKLKTRYLHRAVRGLYLGCLTGGAGFALSGLFCRLVESPLVIEPERYKGLLGNYVQSVCQSGVYFGILSVCVSLVFAVVSYFMKTRIE